GDGLLTDQPSGFRGEQRFRDPAATPPPEWTAPTPPDGVPHGNGAPAGAPPPAMPPPAPTAPQVAQHGVQQPGVPLHGVQAQPPHTGPPPEQAPGAPYVDLSTTALLGQRRPAPSRGWRRWLYRATFRTVNLGESPKVARHNELLNRVRHPLQDCYRIAVLSLKGGVGKTTITATLGSTFGSARGDRVVAVDANPDRGTLSQKVPLQTRATVRDLLRDADRIQTYSDMRAYTSQSPSRLEVLASESDPAVSEAFSSDDYTRTLRVLERFYSLVLTDCGTGLIHSAMSAVLANADVLIVISSGSVDGARSAAATLDWLDAHGHQDMVRNSIAVINAVRPRSGKVDLQKVV